MNSKAERDIRGGTRKKLHHLYSAQAQENDTHSKRHHLQYPLRNNREKRKQTINHTQTQTNSFHFFCSFLILASENLDMPDTPASSGPEIPLVRRRRVRNSIIHHVSLHHYCSFRSSSLFLKDRGPSSLPILNGSLA